MMKTISFLLLLCYVSIMSYAQVTLKSSIHSISADENNYMTTCKYLDPGNAGENVVWDFTRLESLSELNANVEGYSNVYDHFEILQSNVILKEFGNKFFFEVTDNEIKQTGYISADGYTSIQFSTPFIKMKFPFSFLESYTGDLEGQYKTGKIKGTISGEYKVFADAKGTLKLPDNTTYTNTMRVRTDKVYQRKLNNNVQDIHVTSYRWYNAYHRYPLLVLTSYSVKSGNNTYSNYQAAYNTEVIPYNTEAGLKETFDWNIYPNPASSYVYVELEIPEKSDVKIFLYDLNGRLINTMEELENTEGNYYSGFYPAEYNLQHGLYLLKAEVNGKTYTKEIIYSEK